MNEEKQMLSAPEQQPISPTIDEVIAAVELYHPKADFDLIRRAYVFGAEAHKEQRRLSGVPYISHPLAVAYILTQLKMDVMTITSALLHDTIEDTEATREELEQQFGTDVAGLVVEVTDDKSLPKETRKALQVQNAGKKSARAQTLKLADKISNLRSILASPPVDWSLQRRRQYFEWANQVVAGLTKPNSLLKAEFDKTYAMLGQLR